MAGNPYLWDAATPLNNGAADPDINFAEGQTPGSVNNSARGLMAGIAGWLKDTNGSLTTGGTANAHTVTSNIAYGGLAAGIVLCFKAGVTNTGPATLNLTPRGGAAFGAKPMNVFTPSGGEVSLAAGQIKQGGRYIVQYDPALAGGGGAWVVLNPSPAVSAATLTGAALGYQQGMINGTLAVTPNSPSANQLTIAIKTLAGSDPSALDPVHVIFRNASTNVGDFVVLTLAAATSFTVSSGSTLGTVNNVPFRIWIVGFNDAGTLRLGVINCIVGGAAPSQIVSPNEWNSQTQTTAEGGAGAADSAGVIYTVTAIGSPGKAFRILGYAEWQSGLTTAGAWNLGPGYVQLMGPGIKKPGDVVQAVYATSGAITSTTSGTSDVASATTANITPSSAANPIAYFVDGRAGVNDVGNTCAACVFRGATAIGEQQNVIAAGGGVAAFRVGCSFCGIDAPQSTSSQTYAVKFHSVNIGQTATYGPGTVVLKELMG